MSEYEQLKESIVYDRKMLSESFAPVFVAIVLDEIERRAEANMLKTGKLEGMHYAALREVRAELGIERGE